MSSHSTGQVTVAGSWTGGQEQRPRRWPQSCSWGRQVPAPFCARPPSATHTVSKALVCFSRVSQVSQQNINPECSDLCQLSQAGPQQRPQSREERVPQGWQERQENPAGATAGEPSTQLQSASRAYQPHAESRVPCLPPWGRAAFCKAESKCSIPS